MRHNEIRKKDIERRKREEKNGWTKTKDSECFWQTWRDQKKATTPKIYDRHYPKSFIAIKKS